MVHVELDGQTYRIEIRSDDDEYWFVDKVNDIDGTDLNEGFFERLQKATEKRIKEIAEEEGVAIVEDFQSSYPHLWGSSY